jgi:hypothetical protein
MPHSKRGEVNPGMDGTHFFDLSLKEGQQRPNYRGVSMWEISNGSPGWSALCGGWGTRLTKFALRRLLVALLKILHA